MKAKNARSLTLRHIPPDDIMILQEIYRAIEDAAMKARGYYTHKRRVSYLVKLALMDQGYEVKEVAVSYNRAGYEWETRISWDGDI